MNAQVIAQLATAITGIVDQCDPAQVVFTAATKPYKDWISTAEAYAGETQRALEAILAQFDLHAN